jgi:hypothetical protein
MLIYQMATQHKHGVYVCIDSSCGKFQFWEHRVQSYWDLDPTSMESQRICDDVENHHFYFLYINHGTKWAM